MDPQQLTSTSSTLSNLEKELGSWFQEKILHHRISQAAFFAFGTKCFLFLLTAIVLLSDPLHPIVWLTSSLFSLKLWAVVLFSGVCFGATSYFNAMKICTVRRRSWEEKRLPLLLLWDGFFMLSLLIFSNFTGYYLLRISGSTFGSSRHEGSLIVNVGFCFIFWTLFVNALRSTVAYFREERYRIELPVIEQKPWAQFLSNVSFLAKDSFWSVLHTLKWSLLTFPFIGVRVVCGLLWISNDDAPGVVTTLCGLLDLKLVIICALLVSQEDFSVRVMFQWLRYVLTQSINFPVPPTRQMIGVEPKIPYLTLALNVQNFIILKYYSFWSLHRFCQHSASKRAEIFAVSQPGGHPRNWQAVSTSCLEVIDRFDQVVRNANVRLSTAIVSSDVVRVNAVGGGAGDSQFGMDVAVLDGNQRNAMLMPRHLKPFAVNDAKSTRQHSSSKSQEANNKSSLSSQKGKKASSVSSSQWNLLPNFITVHMLGGKRPDNVNPGAIAFEDAQLYVWAIEALSLLVYYSYVEDSLGVVQRDLGSVLGTFLDLQRDLDKYSRLSGSVGASYANSTAYANSKLFGVRQALEGSLGRIVTRFGSHLKSLNLTAQQKAWLATRKL